MRHLHATTLAALLGLAANQSAALVPCGGSFGSFIDNMKAEAAAAGFDRATINSFFDGIANDEAVLRADRRQGVFQKDFIDFSRSLISQNRIDNAARNANRYDAVFDRIEQDYGVPRGVLLAFWAFETDFGAVQGDYNTANALATLGHDCRRPELFQPELLAALELYKHGDFDPDTTTGAWAGEIGMVQMLPYDILHSGRDGDGDGHVTVKTSAPDALMSAAHMVSELGWRAGEPWLQEVVLPADIDLTMTGLNHSRSVRDWARLGVRARQGDLGAAGLEASIVLPVGRFGPAFLAYPNFSIYAEWNQSMTYILTAGYFATRISGAQVYSAGNYEPGLAGPEMQEMQRLLQARGYDVGDIDGILGEKTREAVQVEQQRLGLPADAWPTAAFLARLR